MNIVVQGYERRKASEGPACVCADVPIAILRDVKNNAEHMFTRFPLKNASPMQLNQWPFSEIEYLLTSCPVDRMEFTSKWTCTNFLTKSTEKNVVFGDRSHEKWLAFG